MAIEVRISERTLLADLMSALVRHDCLTYRLSDHACLVVHTHAADAREAHYELNFFIRAWRLGHPYVAAEVVG